MADDVEPMADDVEPMADDVELKAPSHTDFDEQVATLASLYLKINDLMERKGRRSNVLMTYMRQNNKFSPDAKTGKLRYANETAKVTLVEAFKQRSFKPLSNDLALALRAAPSRKLHQTPPRDLLLAASTFSHTMINEMVRRGSLSQEEADTLYITKPETKTTLKLVGPSGADFSTLDDDEQAEPSVPGASESVVFTDLDQEIAEIMAMAREINELKKQKEEVRSLLVQTMLERGFTEYISKGGCTASLIQVESGATFHPPLLIKNQKKFSWNTLIRITRIHSSGVQGLVKTKDLNQEDADSYLVEAWVPKAAHLRFYLK